jgi:hypothetical protein
LSTKRGRKPEAVLAEKEDNLAELKKKLLTGEIRGLEYYRAARPLAVEIMELRNRIAAAVVSPA